MSVCFLCLPANVQTSVFGKACQCDYLQTRGSLLGIYLYVSDGINHMLVAVVLCDTRLYLSLRGLTWIMYHGSQYENSMEDTHMLTSKHVFLKWANLTAPVTASRPLNTGGSESRYRSEGECVCVCVCTRTSSNLTADKRDSNNRLCEKKSKSSRKQILFNFLTKLSCRGSHSLTVTAERNLDKQHDVIGAFCAARLFLKDLRTIFMSVLHCGMRAKRQRDWHEK